MISHNTIINNHTSTSAIMIDNGFGPISDIKVDGNLLIGGGYTVYSDATKAPAAVTQLPGFRSPTTILGAATGGTPLSTTTIRFILATSMMALLWLQRLTRRLTKYIASGEARKLPRQRAKLRSKHSSAVISF